MDTKPLDPAALVKSLGDLRQHKGDAVWSEHFGDGKTISLHDWRMKHWFPAWDEQAKAREPKPEAKGK